MSPLMMIRLWIMVFLHYFVWSAWYVTMGTYLTQTLKFDGRQIGLAYGSTAIGAIVSPFLAGIVADRFFATQKFLGTLHILGAGLLYLVSTQVTFATFYPLLVLYTITYMAGHGLTNTLTLHHAVHAGKEFPIIMMAGSVGWIVAGLVNSGLKLEDNVGMFQLACVAAAVMGVYSFTLPHTPPKGSGQKFSVGTLLGFDALKLLREPSFAAFILCSFLICIPLSFYFAWMSVFLNELGIANAAAKMTIGQVSDVAFLLLLPLLLPLLRVKGILLVGMVAWAIRFGLFAWFDTARDAHWMMYLGIAVHGMCYDFIFVMGRMYVDKRASEEIRGAAQGLHAFVTLGIGMFVGSWLSGAVGQHYAIAGTNGSVTHNWQMIWAIPAALSVVLSVVFVLAFRDRTEAGH